MTKEDFDSYYATFEKASDRARTVLYVFIVVYIAILLYALNAFAYPARQFNFDAVSLEVRCIYRPDDTNCRDGDLKKFLEKVKASPQLEEKVATSLWGHELNLFYDDSVSVRTFKFPIFGLETDRDLLWLIFPLIGMIGYFIVWLALGRLASMFRFMVDGNRNSAVRLRLIQSTLMITAPLNLESDFPPFYRAVWKLLALCVFAIPIIVSLLTIADQTNLIPVLREVRDEHFMNNPTRAFLVKLIIQILLLFLQISLFGRLVSVSRDFGRDQLDARRTIVQLEASGNGSPV